LRGKLVLTNEPTGARDRNEGELDDITTQPSIDVLTLIEAIKAERDLSRKEEAGEDRAKGIREWITIGLVTGTLLAVIYQVSEMIRVYGPIQEQAIASVKAAAAATQQAESAERTRVDLQRAWVGTKRVSLSSEPKVGSAVDITIEFENTGHEPARNFDFIILPHLQFDDSNESSTENAEFVGMVNGTCAQMPDSDRGFVVFPGATGRIESPDNWTRIRQEHLDKSLERGQSMLYITGCFEYSTVGSVHHTSFCYWYKKGITDFRNLRICGGAHQVAD